jgi:tRNA dimethylallyltransferase
MQKMIVIEGPTASGKTALAIQLAKRLKTVVLSADSRQFYREMSIGTAKPSQAEMEGIPHYFIDSHSIENPVSAATYEKEALECIQTKLQAYPYLILVGGSGMFIDALCKGLDPIPTDETIQLELRNEFETKGLAHLLTELKVKDFDYYQQVDQNNPTRIIRALEVIRLTNQKYSTWRANNPINRPFDTTYFVINLPRETLYHRINQRVDNMIEAGLIEEVKRLKAFQQTTALQTVGYKEVFDYLNNTYDLQTCIEKIKQHSRNYAKRQLT